MKGGVALQAEGVGGKRFGVGKAGWANGVRGESAQAGATNAAIVGKRERKNTLGGLFGYVMRRRKSSSRRRKQWLPSRLNRIYQVAKQSCREDPPPLKL
jgi:hypothetical protein